MQLLGDVCGVVGANSGTTAGKKKSNDVKILMSYVERFRNATKSLLNFRARRNKNGPIFWEMAAGDALKVNWLGFIDRSDDDQCFSFSPLVFRKGWFLLTNVSVSYLPSCILLGQLLIPYQRHVN